MRGRCLQTPPKSRIKSGTPLIRPTADRAREALFNIIGSEIQGAAVLDLFAGTGALGLEALSRGAELAVFIDNSHEAIQIINKNIVLCGFSANTSVYKRDLSKGLSFGTKGLPDTAFSVVFVDPPYRKGIALQILQELTPSPLLAPQALVVIEDNFLAELPAQAGDIFLADRRRYGETGFWLYRRK